MVASKKSHRYKGCCMMCARWIRGHGMARRLRFRDLRKLGSKRRTDR
jgi:hypothetical protein